MSVSKSIPIQPSAGLKGHIQVPGDKSISHRAVMFAALATGASTIEGLLLGEDVLSTMRIFRQLGVKMSSAPEHLKSGQKLVIHGVGLHGLKAPSEILDCGNSGTTMRLLLGLLAAQTFTSTLTGDDSLNRRPMERVMNPLKEMGADFQITQDKKGRRLITVKGNPQLKGKNFVLPVASAQVKSALLLAGLYAQGGVQVTEPMASRDHTERMLASQGARLVVDGNTVSIRPTEKLNSFHIQVPGDFSSAAFFIVAGLIVPNSKITISNVCINPTRAALAQVLKKMAPDALQFLNERDLSGERVADILVTSQPLTASDISGDIVPSLIDEIPIFTIAAALAQGVSTISDAQELRVKESDRLAVMAQQLKKLGVDVTEKPDGLLIRGNASFTGGSFQSHGDHRVAMSFAIAALVSKGASQIEDIDCVATSFPTFFELLKSLQKSH